MRRAVVSGVTGHLGREVARQLAVAGVEVNGLTRQESLVSSGGWCTALRLHKVDGRTQTLLEIFKAVQPDVVFHIAGVSRREHLSADIEPFVTANILLGTQLLEATRLSGCRRFITAGSYLQHCHADGYRAFNLYAATKQAFENMLSFYVDATSLLAARLMLCDIYSEWDTRKKLMTDIASAWKLNSPLMVCDEKACVDLVHVEDAAAAFLQTESLLDADALAPGAFYRYSVTSGYNVNVAQLVALFERLGGHGMTLNRGESRDSTKRITPWRGAVVPGWVPKVSIEDGVRRILMQSSITPPLRELRCT